MLSPTDLLGYEKSLQALVDRFQGDVTELQAETRQAPGSGRGDFLTPALSLPGDAVRADEEIDLVLLEHEKAQFTECWAALARIEEGTFGRCQDCQRPIPGRRLKAFPYASMFTTSCPWRENEGRVAI